MQTFNKSDPCEPKEPEAGVSGMLSLVGKMAGAFAGVESTVQTQIQTE